MLLGTPGPGVGIRAGGPPSERNEEMIYAYTVLVHTEIPVENQDDLMSDLARCIAEEFGTGSGSITGSSLLVSPS
jgi:hypothetical protein